MPAKHRISVFGTTGFSVRKTFVHTLFKVEGYNKIVGGTVRRRPWNTPVKERSSPNSPNERALCSGECREPVRFLAYICWKYGGYTGFLRESVL